MKKIIILLSTIFAFNEASAQVSIAPEVGIQMTNVSFNGDSVALSPDARLNFRAGLNLAYNFSEKLNLHVGAFYTVRGFKANLSSIEVQQTMNYIDVPVYVNYNIIEFMGNKVFVGAGPYVGYCISGKVKSSGNILGFSFDEEEDLNIGSDETNDDITALDFGANVNAGIVTKMGLYARVNYGMGFANLIPGGDSDNNARNRGFGLSIGYQIKL